METWSTIQEEKNEISRGEKIKEYISANLAGDLSIATVSQKFEPTMDATGYKYRSSIHIKDE